MKVKSLSPAADPWTKTGILVWNDFKKTSSGGGFAVMVTRDNGFTVHYDSIAPVGRFDSPQGGTATAVFPCWLRAVKKGAIFSGYYKTDINSPWILLKDARTTQGIVAGGNSQIGLFIASHNFGVTSTSQMGDFQGGGDIQANNLNLAFDGTSVTSDNDARLTGNLSAASVDLSAYSGMFSFQNFNMTVSGNANFNGTGSINAGSGILTLNGSGTQMLTPRPGQIFPAIVKSGSGTVQITAQPMVAGKLTMSAGNFDLGGRTNEFAGLAGTGGSFSAPGSGDTLILTDDANFSGITSVPITGSIQIRAQGPGKSITFAPGNVTYNNLYLWPNPTSSTANRITVGAGTLKVQGKLFLRDQKTAGLSGIVDFRANNTSVAADGDIIRIDEGSTGTSSLSLLMGNGTWTAKGNVSLSVASPGSADSSTLDLAGTGTQILTLTGGSLNKVNHASTGTLQLGSALSAASLAQSGGLLNFNSANLTLSGNLRVTNGTPGTFIGLGGRTLAVGGSASFAGTAGSLLNLNPAADWNMQAAGKLTADYAIIGKSAATASTGNTTPTCTDALGNKNWLFGTIAPPIITRQTPDTSVLSGQAATFSVHATGSGALVYDWIKKGDAAILSHDTLYTIGATALTDNAAQYQCTVRNEYGGVTAAINLTVNEPASVSHATADTSVLLGKPAVFSVSARGSGTITYAWYRKGVVASIFSGPVYTLANPAMADSGAIFYCIVGNGFGTPVRTADAILSVDEPAAIVVPPANIAVILGQKADFTVIARGSNKLAYEWHRAGVTAPIPGATAATYTLDPAAKADSGASFYCIVSNDYGPAASPAAKLTVNALQQPHDTIVLAGQTALFKVSAGSAPTTAFSWYRKGDTAAIGHDSVLTVSPVKSSDDNARFFCKVSTPSGTLTTGEAILTVAKIPVVTREPVKAIVLSGQTATFSISVSGTPSLGYQWKKKSSSATFVGDSVLTLPAVTVADNNAVFYCIIANFWGRDTTLEAILIVNEPALITREPKDTVVVAGQKAAFTVGAKGTGPLAFAWHRKGDTTTLSTDTAYTVNPATLADSGSIFQCIVSNDFGRDTTREAKLIAVQAAIIVREPKDITVGVGRKAVFSVGAVGANPVTYKWRKQGDTTGIGKDSIYTIDSVKLSDNGKSFTVIVANGFGSDTSLAAKLAVVVCDSLFKVTPESLTVDEGQPVLLAGEASCSDSYLWSAVSGPAPRILDPEVKALALNAPRVLADTAMVYQFSATYGSATVSRQIRIKVKEAIPDPRFSLKPAAKWNGLTPLVMRPALTNDAALKASKYAPPFRYQWTISGIIADTAQAGDSLSLSHPVESGLLDIHLCLDNGGVADCEGTTVDVAILPVSLRRAIASASGPVARAGANLFWLSPARIRIWTWEGRILWEHGGMAGEMAALPDDASRALLHHRARMEILPR